MSSAFITYYKLASSLDVFSEVGKLATMLFEGVVLQVPGTHDVEHILHAALKRGYMAPGVVARLGTVWSPVHRLLPEYEWMGRYLKGDWRGNELLESAIAQVPPIDELPVGVLSDYPPELPVGASKMYPVLVEGAAVWTVLSAIFPIAMMCNSIEAEAIELFFSGGGKAPKGSFRGLFAWPVPAIGDLSWERVLELRESALLERARAKLAEAHRLMGRGYTRTAADVLEDLCACDLDRITKAIGPCPRKMTLIAVMSKDPLPIPIHPALISSGADRAVEKHSSDEKIGWLYFLFARQGQGGSSAALSTP